MTKKRQDMSWAVANGESKRSAEGGALSPEQFVDEWEQGAQLAEAFAGSSSAERERLARIVDLLPCYVVLITSEHEIRFYNKAFSDFFGPVDNRPCYAVLRNQQTSCAYCAPLEAAFAGSSCVTEWLHVKSNHAFRVYTYPFKDTDGQLLALKVGFNITSNIRVQQALDLSEQSYHVITDNLSIGIALLSPELRVKAGNSRLAHWFGEAIKQESRICDVLRCPPYTEGILKTGTVCPGCPFQEAALANAPREKEFPIVLQDGRERLMRVVACPVAPKPRKVRALIMMLEDITTRQHISQQLHRAKKLEAVGTLAGGIAHEINQPLSALHLYASGLQMLLEKSDAVTQDTLKERLGLIMHEADRIRGIIAHMRALVMREGNVSLENVAVFEAVAGVLGIMRQQLSERNVLVTVDVEEQLPFVRANTIQLEQVLVNLLANGMHALDSVGDGEGRGVAKEILIRARVKPDRTHVILEVADSGAGLPDGSERIFDPFFSNSEQPQGMGLGLSIVHGIVTLWGGGVYAVPHHRELGGAGFYVEIPIVNEAG